MNKQYRNEKIIYINMITLFEEYFYHDVCIKKISVIYSENTVPGLEFILVNEENNVFKCSFFNIYDLSLQLNNPVKGNAFIINAFINNTDILLTNFCRNTDLLNNINCFVIETSRGDTIKILSDADIVMSQTGQYE